MILLRWNSTATTVAGITSSYGSAADKLWSPCGIAVGLTNTLFIADAGNKRVQKYIEGASSGTTIAGLGTGSNGTLDLPVDIAVDSSDGAYIVDTSSDRIMFWRANASVGRQVAGSTSKKKSSPTMSSHLKYIYSETQIR